VLVLAGEHVGEVGYDDDEDDGDDGVVYLREPFASEYVCVPRAQLEPVATSSIEVERWKRAHPWLAKYLGVP
jgi:hypothetical protein